MSQQTASQLEHHLQDQASKQEEFDKFFWHRVRWEAARVAFPKQEEFELLDIGAGTGQVGRFLKNDCPQARYRFVEPLPSLKLNLIQHYGYESNFDGVVDYKGVNVLTCLDVLEHIENDQEFITQTVLKMEKGSRLFLTVPAMMLLWSPWDQAMGHYRRYSKKSLINLFKSQPVRINRCHYLFPEMVVPGLIRRFNKKDSSEGGEFPQLPSFVNKLFYGLSSLSRLTGAVNPFGSSLLIDVTKD